MNNLHIILLIVILILLIFTYNREKFLNNIICDTIDNKEDCLSYGCEMKQIKVEDITCLDEDKLTLNEKNSCKIRYETDREKLIKMITSIEISRENIKYEDFVPEHNNHYIRLVKPNKLVIDYLNIEDKDKNIDFYINNKFVEGELKIPSWSNNSNSILDSNDKSVNILIFYRVKSDIKVVHKVVNVGKLKSQNDKYLNQLNSFDYCYKLGGNEVNYVKGLVRCDNPTEFNKCEYRNSIVKGCLHNKTKEACLSNKDKTNLDKNDCKWVSSYSLPDNKVINYYTGYCVNNNYEIDTNNLENECLFKNEDDCKASTECIYNNNTKKCLNKNHIKCDDFITKTDCNNDIDCLWDENYEKCNVKKNVINLLHYDGKDIVSANIIDKNDTNFLKEYWSLALEYEKEKVKQQFLKF